MSVSKERLLEIEKELNSLPIHILIRKENGRRSIRYNSRNNSEVARRTQSISRTCPHCTTTGKGNAFLTKHFNKCYFNPSNINLTKFIDDSKVMPSRELSTKYSIPRAKVMKFLRTLTQL